MDSEMLSLRRASNLDSLSRIAHGFFGRIGGVSKGIYESLNCGLGSSDLGDNAIENRRRAIEALAPGAALVTQWLRMCRASRSGFLPPIARQSCLQTRRHA